MVQLLFGRYTHISRSAWRDQSMYLFIYVSSINLYLLVDPISLHLVLHQRCPILKFVSTDVQHRKKSDIITLTLKQVSYLSFPDLMSLYQMNLCESSGGSLNIPLSLESSGLDLPSIPVPLDRTYGRGKSPVNFLTLDRSYMRRIQLFDSMSIPTDFVVNRKLFPHLLKYT